MIKTLLLILILAIVTTGCTKVPTTLNVQNQEKEQSTTDTLSNKKPSQKIKANITSKRNQLDLSNSTLDKVSQNIFQQTNLQELNLSHNNLTGSLPGEIRHLQKLEILNISNNQMTGIPAEVGQLKNLRILDLSNNQFTGLPYELGNLNNLEILNLSGNNYSTLDFDIIRQNLPSDVNIIL